MNTDRFPRPIPISSMAALAGCLVVIMAFGGAALAASAPTITKIIQKDDNGTPSDPSDDKVITMATGYEANKVAFDALSNAYVTDAQMGLIYRFNSNGHLAKATSAIYTPLGVSAYNKYDAVNNKTVTTIFAGGIANDYRTAFMLGLDGNVTGYFKRLLPDVSPMYFGHPNDIAVDPSGNVYIADDEKNVVQKFDENGVFLKTFGPYPANLTTPSDKYFNSETIGGTLYYRTKHTMTAITGVVVSNGEMYVAFSERVEYLTVAGDPNCALDATSCYSDTENSYNYYSNTGSTYNKWYSIGNAQVVAVLDLSDGRLKRKITVYPFVKFTASGGASYRLTDAAVDNSGRIYVATNYGMMVFDAAIDNPKIDVPSAALSVTQSPAGSVPATSINGLAYDGTYNRLMISVGNIVTLFGIDTYTSPTNKAPEAPVLLSPVSTYAPTLSPSLEVKNAIDPEADPLTYGYEIRDSNGVPISSFNIVEGAAGKTSMPVNATLIENSLYRWRARSFDGNLSTWSAGDWETDKNNWAEFCVNAQNDNPDAPVLTNPVSGASVSSFSSSLAWNPSKDPDCYDTVSYTVEISADPNFGSLLSSRTLSDQSIKLGDIASGLNNKSTYYWRVKAVDNNGGESGYSAASFTYRTTVVKFESNQSDAKVYIDGNYGYFGRSLGSAPLTVEGINPGSHFVTFVKAGYEPVYKIVHVADPLDNNSSLTVIAGAEEWIKASRIRPAASGAELFRTSGNSTPFVVDYNNDGLKDVITGDASGNVYLYLSEKQLQADGSEKIILVAKGALQNINVGSRAVPFVVDYNNDGKKDLLVGSGDGLIYLYLNSGTDDSPAFTTAETIKDSSGFDIKTSDSAPNVVDYNNDGKKDLVVGGAEGVLRLYINIGTDASPVFGVPVLIKADNSDLSVGPNINSKVFFTDWNSDGKKDMVVGGNTLHLFLNVGADAAPDFKSIASLQDWIKDKKRERGNREFIPYLGYNQDMTDVVGGSTDVAPFVVNWDGSSARDIIAGAADGAVIAHVSPE